LHQWREGHLLAEIRAHCAAHGRRTVSCFLSPDVQRNRVTVRRSKVYVTSRLKARLVSLKSFYDVALVTYLAFSYRLFAYVYYLWRLELSLST
jgi:hypothetical protein